MTEKVSIIVPVHNTEEYLSDCIDSILKQSHHNIEIILINDGSSDRSASICDNYRNSDSRVIVIHQDNKGVSSARNAGLDIMTGSHVAFVDSDDIIPSHYISRLLDVIKSTGSDVAACSSTRILDSLSEVSSREYNTRIFSGNEAIMNTLYQKEISNGPHAKLFNSSSIQNLRFREDLAIAEDLEFNCRVFEQSTTVAYFAEKMYGYRERPDSALSSQFNAKKMDEVYASEIVLNRHTSKDMRLAATNRVFMSAIFIAVQIPLGLSGNEKYLRQCKLIIKKYSLYIAGDKSSLPVYRLLAIFGIIYWRIPVNIVKLKTWIKRSVVS